MVGVSVAISATSAGCPNPRYRFWILSPFNSGVWTMVQDYSSISTYTWNSPTDTAHAGIWRLSIWVHDASNPDTYDAYDASQYYTLTAGCSIAHAHASPTSPSSVGTQVTISGTSYGCLNDFPQYRFYIRDTLGAWAMVKNYATDHSTSYLWSTSGRPTGIYQFSVWVHDSGNSGTICPQPPPIGGGCYDAYDASQFYTLT